MTSKTHKNALLSVSGHKAKVESFLIGKLTKVAVARKFNVTPATARKWFNWYVSEGESGLEDCSSRPHNSPRATPPEKVHEIIRLRKNKKLTGYQIAREMNMHQRKVSRYLIQANLSRLEDIEE